VRVSFFLLFIISTFLLPLAPRALPRFSATTKALSPSRHGSSGLRQTMNAAPSPVVIPDSCRSNFQPFHLHPPYAPLSLRSLSRRRSGREVAAVPSRVGFRLGLRHFLRMLANASGRIEFIIFLIMDWLFASGCPPPRLSATQLPSATDSQCSVRRGLSPRCWCALSGARRTPTARHGDAQLVHR